MKEVLDIFGSTLLALSFCFTIFTIKSCVIEQDKIALERLKIPHKVQRTNTATVESSGATK